MEKMKKATVIGHFDWRGNDMIGAVVKARNILEELKKKNYDIGDLDIYGWRKRKVSTVIGIIKAFVTSSNIILVISDTSLTLMRLFATLKGMFHRKILYCVVGGDIADRLSEDKTKIKALDPVDHFFVETIDCLEKMKDLGVTRTSIMKNFKCIDALEIEEESRFKGGPFEFCTFSRVTEQKGISDAIMAIESINNERGEKICQLDVYGVIDPSYDLKFKAEIANSNSCRYCGVINPNMSVNTLQKYYCLLFPTKYQTEGIPGTIIDGFASGLPVICSDWQRSRQLVTDGKNGFIYPFGDLEGLKDRIIYSIENVTTIEGMRKECIKSFEEYKPENAIRVLIDSMQ